MQRFRISALALAAALSLSLAVPAAAVSDAAGPYADSIQALADRDVIKGDGTGAYRPGDPLTRAAAASLLYEAFDLVPVFSMEAPAPEASEDGAAAEPVTKEFYSTATTVATLDAALMPAAPDAVDTWAETAANTVLEARLMDQIDGAFHGEQAMTRADFALAVMKAVYGADRDMDFLAQGAQDGLLPDGLTLDGTVITRGEAAWVLDTATKDLTIITTMSTSDIHGHMTPYTPSGSAIEVGGSAKAAWLFAEAERRNPNTLVLDGGDSPYNTDLANMSQGQSSVDVMNAQGYDATVLGNHDFDYSFDNLLSLADRAEYAMLSANTYWKDGTYPEQFDPYIVKEVGGLKVAIVGLTDDGSKATTHYSNTQDIDFHDQWEVGQQVVDLANAEADLVIVLAHLHGANNEVPTRIDGIDMEIGGGNDTFGRPLNIGDTVVVNPGGVGTCVNQTNLNVKDGELLGYTFNQIILSSDVPEVSAVNDKKHDYDRVYDTFRQLAPEAGGLDTGDDTVFDVVDEGGVDCRQGAGRQGQVLEAHAGQGVQHLVHHMVSVSEVVVEGDGHAVLEPRAADGLLQAPHHLVLPPGPVLEGGGVLLRRPGEGSPVADLPDVGDPFKGVFVHGHTSSTSSTASARAMSRLARVTTGLSIIFPLRLATPLPRALASRMASMTA